ncbi:MAG: hypothetical protein QM764_21630 [Chitinophagaceae bacterium]
MHTKKGHGNRIGDYQYLIADGVLKVVPEMKLYELEIILRDKFKLKARVLRQADRRWLQTTLTNHWSLQKQNELSLELSELKEFQNA